jgi:hypothetical protein
VPLSHNFSFIAIKKDALLDVFPGEAEYNQHRRAVLEAFGLIKLMTPLAEVSIFSEEIFDKLGKVI